MAVLCSLGREGFVPVALHGDGLQAVAVAGRKLVGGEVHRVAVARQRRLGFGVAYAALSGEASVLVENVELHMAHVVFEKVGAERVVVVGKAHVKACRTVAPILGHHRARGGCDCRQGKDYVVCKS